MLTSAFVIVISVLISVLISLVVLWATKNLTIGTITCITVGIIVPALFGFLTAFTALPISLILFFVLKNKVL
jgi:hypothetical protein